MSEIIEEEKGLINLSLLLAYLILKHGPFEFSPTEALDLVVSDANYQLTFEEKDDDPGVLILGIADVQDDD